MPKLKNWGGARPGSGRPIVGKEKRQITTIALEPVLLAALERYAKQAGLSRNEAVNRLLSECLLSTPPEPSYDDLAGMVADIEQDTGPTLAPCLDDVLSYSPAHFGQWLAENLLPLSPELQSQYKARWSSENSKLNCFRQYGPELIGAIKAGKIGLVPAPTLLMARKTDTELRKDLINLAGITF